MTAVLEPMKVVVALKELNLILKKMTTTDVRITEISAHLSNEVPRLGSEQAHMDKMKELTQSNLDLAERYLALKRALDKTNLATSVTITGKTYTVTDLLNLRRKLGTPIIATFQSMNDEDARRRVGHATSSRVQGDAPITVVRYYDDDKRYEAIAEWQEFLGHIDGKLEVVNAVTDLIIE